GCPSGISGATAEESSSGRSVGRHSVSAAGTTSPETTGSSTTNAGPVVVVSGPGPSAATKACSSASSVTISNRSAGSSTTGEQWPGNGNVGPGGNFYVACISPSGGTT